MKILSFLLWSFSVFLSSQNVVQAEQRGCCYIRVQYPSGEPTEDGIDNIMYTVPFPDLTESGCYQKREEVKRRQSGALYVSVLAFTPGRSCSQDAFD